MPTLTLRIKFGPKEIIGPGKIDLLERIAKFGSIAAAGRTMNMSYRRAWELVEVMNRIFGCPVVEPQIGGKQGGGATLTSLGLTVIVQYRAMEQAAEQAARPYILALQAEIVAKPPEAFPPGPVP